MFSVDQRRMLREQFCGPVFVQYLALFRGNLVFDEVAKSRDMICTNATRVSRWSRTAKMRVTCEVTMKSGRAQGL